MQTLDQTERAIQAFEDARLARHLDRLAEEEREGDDDGLLRLCGDCGEAIPFDGADVFKLMGLLPERTGRTTRKAVETMLRQCLWCSHLTCVVGEGDEACDRWIYYGDR